MFYNNSAFFIDQLDKFKFNKNKWRKQLKLIIYLAILIVNKVTKYFNKYKMKIYLQSLTV